MSTPRAAALVIGLTVAVGFIWYQGQATVPAGQPPLVTLDASSLEALRGEFNRHADSTRLIVLLSPT